MKRVPHFSVFIDMSDFELTSGVEEHNLDNGLRILLKAVPTSAVVSTWIFYKVGSRNESPGVTGCSHWCEHMMFKGGGKLGKGEVHNLVSDVGGRNNAFTDQDLTAYFETLPKEDFETALFIESERMKNSAFDPNEVESERQVIVSEREGSENYPTYLLREELYATSFRMHPYRWPVVGWKEDLKRMTRDDLYNHYRKFYDPSNATLVVCGNFHSQETLTLITKYFAKISGQQSDTKVTFDPSLAEPEQMGERTTRLEKPGTLDYIAAGFHVPSALDEDTPSLVVLSTVLGGWKGLIGFSPDRFVPRSNRLYKKLVEGKVASAVNTYYPVKIDPGLLYFELTILPGVSDSTALDSLLAEFNKMSDSLPEESEMRVAFNQIKSWHSYENDSATLQAQSLGFMETMGKRSLGDDLVKSCLKVTPEEVRHVARKYLAERNRTVCIYKSKD